MRAADVIIAWTPAMAAGAQLGPDLQLTAGQIAILAWPEGGTVISAYARALGGPDEGWRTADRDDLLARLRIAFRTMVMRDGINPMAVHASFLQIDEYRGEIFREQARSRGGRCRGMAASADLRRIG